MFSFFKRKATKKTTVVEYLDTDYYLNRLVIVSGASGFIVPSENPTLPNQSATSVWVYNLMKGYASFYSKSNVKFVVEDVTKGDNYGTN